MKTNGIVTPIAILVDCDNCGELDDGVVVNIDVELIVKVESALDDVLLAVILGEACTANDILLGGEASMLVRSSRIAASVLCHLTWTL